LKTKEKVGGKQGLNPAFIGRMSSITFAGHKPQHDERYYW